MRAGNDNAWFEYAKTPGRFTAVPCSWQGWVSLFLAIIAITVVAMIVSGLGFQVHPVAGAVSILVTVTLGLFLTFKLVVAKGRPAES